MPDRAPEIYAAEQAAVGVRGSYLAYRSDVFHRGAAFAEPGTSRTVLALAFKIAAQEWIGYDEAQSRCQQQRVDAVRRAVDASRPGAVRLPPARSRDLGRGPVAEDAEAIPQSGHEPLAAGVRRLKALDRAPTNPYSWPDGS